MDGLAVGQMDVFSWDRANCKQVKKSKAEEFWLAQGWKIRLRGQETLEMERTRNGVIVRDRRLLFLLSLPLPAFATCEMRWQRHELADDGIVPPEFNVSQSHLFSWVADWPWPLVAAHRHQIATYLSFVRLNMEQNVAFFQNKTKQQFTKFKSWSFESDLKHRLSIILNNLGKDSHFSLTSC